MKNTILSIDPSETIEVEITRHPIGLVPIVFTGLFTALVFITMALFQQRILDYFGIDFSGALVTIFLIVLAATVCAATAVAVKIYRSNYLIVTNENLIQIIQTSLFSRKVSQLSLEKVQDVTTTQRGVIQSLFNYGTIFIETAGETANFGFQYSPNPVVNAKHINEAHERFIKKYGIDVV